METPSPSKEPRVVYIGNAIEAAMVKGRLLAEGIRAETRDDNMGGGLLKMAGGKSGGVKVVVPGPDVARTVEILGKLLKKNWPGMPRG